MTYIAPNWLRWMIHDGASSPLWALIRDGSVGDRVGNEGVQFTNEAMAGACAPYSSDVAPEIDHRTEAAIVPEDELVAGILATPSSGSEADYTRITLAPNDDADEVSATGGIVSPVGNEDGEGGKLGVSLLPRLTDTYDIAADATDGNAGIYEVGISEVTVAESNPDKVVLEAGEYPINLTREDLGLKQIGPLALVEWSDLAFVVSFPAIDPLSGQVVTAFLSRTGERIYFHGIWVLLHQKN